MIEEVYLDLDDVLNAFTGSIGKLFGVCTDPNDLSWCNPALGFDMLGQLRYASECQGKKFDHTLESLWDSVKFEHWVECPLSPTFNQVLEYAQFLVPREKIFIATSPTKCPHASSGKVEWMNRHLPQWLNRNYFITPRKWKLSAPGRLLIDDHWDNCKRWFEGGGTAHCVTKPWNDYTYYNGKEAEYFSFLRGSMVCGY